MTIMMKEVEFTLRCEGNKSVFVDRLVKVSNEDNNYYEQTSLNLTLWSV